MNFFPIFCARLILRRFNENDLGPFASYMSDSDVARFQSWSSMNNEQALDFIHQQQEAQFGTPGEWFQIAIASRETDLLIGDIGVCIKADDPTCAEIGFTLSQENQGKGFASEAVISLISLLFEKTEVDRVEATTDARNVKSIELLRRIGMKQEKTQQAWFKGSECTEFVFGIARKDWGSAIPSKSE